MKARADIPPWVRDGHPELWFAVSIAARFYFRKHPTTIKRAIKTGELGELGIKSYWDGYQWYVRLPAMIPVRPKKLKQASA